MKYRILVTGNNTSVIDSFFNQMENNFEALTTSIRYADIIRHMNCYEPDAFVYCLHDEQRDHIMQMASIKYKLAQENIPFILIGSKEECDEFEKMAANVTDLSLYRPLSAEAVQERILKFFRGKKPRQEGAAQKDAAKENTASMGGIPAGASAASPTGIPAPAGTPSAPGKTPQAGTSLPIGNPFLAGSGTPQGGADSQRKHILVVDDNSMMLRLVKEHLHDKYDVATALSGKIALKFLQKKKTDLILLDYEMPICDGRMTLEMIRADEEMKDIPVVFLTAINDRANIEAVLKLKPAGYFLKPAVKDKLLMEIDKILNASS